MVLSAALELVLGEEERSVDGDEGGPVSTRNVRTLLMDTFILKKLPRLLLPFMSTFGSPCHAACAGGQHPPFAALALTLLRQP